MFERVESRTRGVKIWVLYEMSLNVHLAARVRAHLIGTSGLKLHVLPIWTVRALPPHPPTWNNSSDLLIPTLPTLRLDTEVFYQITPEM